MRNRPFIIGRGLTVPEPASYLGQAFLYTYKPIFTHENDLLELFPLAIVGI